jgi:hypothetical protein
MADHPLIHYTPVSGTRAACASTRPGAVTRHATQVTCPDCRNTSVYNTAPFYAAILTTAIEPGGVSRWFEVTETERSTFEGDTAPDRWAIAVTLLDHRAVDGAVIVIPPRFPVDLGTIARGWRRVKNRLEIPRDLAEAVQAADRDRDAGQVDADMADLVTQLGLFDEVIYH